MRRSIDASADTKKLLEEQLALKNPTFKPASPSTTGRPQFVSPPSSPPPSGQAVPPITTSSAAEAEAPRSEGLQTPSVAVQPPTPVNLNDERRAAAQAQVPFQAPPPPPPFQAPPPPPPIQSPPESSQMEGQDEPFSPPSDRPLSGHPSSLHRTASNEAGRMRGPRVQARAGGPRASPGGARAPPSTGGQTPESPRMSASNTPPAVPQRTRTPPNASDYAPSKRGGRAAAGSFSRRPE